LRRSAGFISTAVPGAARALAANGRRATPFGRFRLCAAAGTLAIAASAWHVTSSAQPQTDALAGLVFGAAGLALVIAGGARRRRREPPARRERGHARSIAIEYDSRDVAEAYDRRRFGSLAGRYNNWRLHRLLNGLVRALPPGSLVLDVPCGTGRIDGCLLRRSFRVVAADISTAMLTVARRKLRPQRSGLEFVRADANRLPLRSQSVQAVLCIRFLHLMDPPERRVVLAEMARVANHWVIVEYRNVDPYVKAAKRVMMAWLRGDVRRQRRTVSGIDQELQQCGLVAEDYYYVSRWFSGSVLVAARRHSSAAHVGADLLASGPST
jgi:ubiquinone/menaquinone biosynthesis C-methylase UbiE